MISDYLKAKLATEIPGILDATSHLEGGRQVIRINGASAIVGPFASDNEVEAGIRTALNIPDQQGAGDQTDGTTEAPRSVTPLPAVNLTEAKPMAPAPPRPGSFISSIRAMMDDARAGVDQAKADVLDQVKEAVGELHEAKASVAHVGTKMVQNIKDQAADIRAELGQISNDLGE